MTYWPAWSAVTVRTPSIRAGRLASTVTPGRHRARTRHHDRCQSLADHARLFFTRSAARLRGASLRRATPTRLPRWKPRRLGGAQASLSGSLIVPDADNAATSVTTKGPDGEPKEAWARGMKNGGSLRTSAAARRREGYARPWRKSRRTRRCQTREKCPQGIDLRGKRRLVHQDERAARSDRPGIDPLNSGQLDAVAREGVP